MKCAAGKTPLVRIALAKQACITKPPDKVASPETIAAWLKTNYGCAPQEHGVAIGLTSQMTPLGVLEIALGGFDQAAIDPKVVFSGLLAMGATVFILAHNHPSGIAVWSSQDYELTRSLKAAGKVIHVQMIDHLLLTGSTVLSMRTSGVWDTL